MPTLIRTSDVPSAHRHDAWRSIVCETLGQLEMRIDPDTPLRGEIDAGSLGPVSVGRVKTSTPHSVHRTPGLIRIARLRPGEFTIYDFNRPYELAYDSGVQLAVFSFPRAMCPVSVLSSRSLAWRRSPSARRCWPGESSKLRGHAEAADRPPHSLARIAGDV